MFAALHVAYITSVTTITIWIRSVAKILKKEEMPVLKIDHAILKIDSCQTTQLSQSISKDGRVTAQIDRCDWTNPFPCTTDIKLTVVKRWAWYVSIILSWCIWLRAFLDAYTGKAFDWTYFLIFVRENSAYLWYRASIPRSAMAGIPSK